jgi:hypothetical protein
MNFFRHKVLKSSEEKMGNKKVKDEIIYFII